MYMTNLYYVTTRDHVIPFYRVGKAGMVSHIGADEIPYDWLSTNKNDIRDRDHGSFKDADYKDLVINKIKERQR